MEEERVIELVAQMPKRIKPQTPEQRDRVFACFNALETRKTADGLQLTLQTQGGYSVVYVYATRIGYATLEEVLAIAGEFDLKVSIMAEQYVANAAGLGLFGGAEGAPATYARFGLMVAPPIEYEEPPPAEPDVAHTNGSHVETM